MFNLLVLGMGILNIVFYTQNHSPLSLAAGIFAIAVFLVTSR